MKKTIDAKNVAAVERERERELLFSEIEEGRNTFISHIKKTESLNRNI